MTRLAAHTVDLQTAFVLLGEFAGPRAARGLPGSAAWCHAAADVRGQASMAPIVLSTAAGDAVGVLILERRPAGWRSGSPGQACLRWPFQEFGYHFAPAWRTRRDGDRHWIAALTTAFPRDHLELRRSAPGACAQPMPARVRVVEGPATWVLAVDGDFDRWRAGLAGDHRRDLGYYERKIGKAGGAWDDLAETGDLDAALGDCFDLHARRVTAKGQSSLYLEPQARRFLARLATLDRTHVRITRLRIAGAVVAAALSFVHDGRYRCFMPGWDPRHRTLDLGRQVIYHQIRREFAADTGLASIDLLGGDLPYKREFGLAPHPTADIIARPTAAAAAREEFARSALRVYRRLVGS